MSTVTTHSTLTSSHSGSTQRHTATSSSSSSSVGAPIIDGAGGPVASLDARAAVFKKCAAQAMAAADEAAADAERIKRAHAEMIEVHRKLFLAKAFRINPDGTAITNPSAFLLTGDPPAYHSVKSVEHYNEIIHVLTNWGDDKKLKDLPPNDPEVQRCKAFRTKNRKNGYNYSRAFSLQETQAPDGTTKVNLIHKKSNGIVCHMLDIFDIISEAHSRLGHLAIEKTLANCQPTFYSPTYALCKLFCDDCFVCHEKPPSISAPKGAKKPIISSHFRDRIQVDLIDMRTMRKRDVYGLMQRWIMTVKDHSTGLVYLAALPQKKAEYVASELEKYFGFAGFPHILHTDNGKEFIATLVVDMMMRHNPDCFLVTGRPRTPRDQGSVENANRMVKQVLMSLSRERQMQGIETNWTKILGQVMSVCNSHSGTRRYSTSSYQAVFGLPYHPELRCTVAKLRECKTIGQRLNLSPDDRLATYVREHNIVDYMSDLGGGGVSSQASNGDNADMDGDDEEEGLDLSDNAFPDVLSQDYADDDAAECTSLPGIDLCDNNGDNNDAEILPGIDFRSTSPSVEACLSPVITQDHNRKSSKADMNPSDDIVSVSSTTTTKDNCDGPQNVNWSYTRADEHSTYTVAEAWDNGNIARKQSSLGDTRQYNFLWPTLSCEDCCHPHGCFQLQVGDDDYIWRITNTTDWYDGIFI
jgi:hypothetical protein